VPQKESDVEKIKTLLLNIEAEGIKEHADANLKSIRSAAKGMRHQAAAAEAALKERKLVTHQDALNFQGAIDLETISIQEFKLIDGPTVLQHWGVASWLTNKDRQDQGEWPEILGTFCQGYADLLSAYTTIVAFANGADMRAAFVDVHPDNRALKLSETDRHDVEQALLKLTEYAKKRLQDIKDCNEIMSDELEKLAPAARDRGIFWYRADTSWNPHIQAGDNIRKALTAVAGMEVAKTSVTMARNNLGRLNPELHVFGVESSYNNNEAIRRGMPDKNTIYYGKLNSPYTDLNAGGWRLLEEAPGFHSPVDIWATPGKNDTEVYFYTAKDKEIYGYLFDPANGRAANPAPAKAPVYHKTVKSELVSVRVVRSPVPLHGDPDDAELASLLKGVDYIAYAGLKSSTEIYVEAKGTEGYVPGPTGWGAYTGIAVDRNYLWVYAWGGPACATHASVMKCLAERLKGNMTTPRWIQNQIPDALEHIYEGHGEVPKGRTAYGYIPATQLSRWSDNPPPPKGLVDLCACDDGTFFAGVYKRSIAKAWALAQGDYWAVADTLALYTGVHQVHLKEGTMDVDWSVIPANIGVRIQKLPIYCWPLFANLEAACRATRKKVGPS